MRLKIIGVIGFTVGIVTGNLVVPSLFASIVGAASLETIPAMWSGVIQVAVLGMGFGMAGLGTKIVRSQIGRLELAEATD